MASFLPPLLLLLLLLGLVKRHGEYKRKNPIGVLPVASYNYNK